MRASTALQSGSASVTGHLLNFNGVHKNNTRRSRIADGFHNSFTDAGRHLSQNVHFRCVEVHGFDT
jgi:hypothetical protein